VTECEEAPEFAEVPDRPNPYALYPWLLIIGGPASDVISGRSHPAWLAGAGLLTFAVVYLAAIWLRLRADRTREACLLAAILAAITFAMAAAFGLRCISTLFPLLALVCGAVIPWREPKHGPPHVLLAVFVVADAAAVMAGWKHASASDTWQAFYGTVLAGWIVAIIFRFIAAIAELRRTRRELARTMVNAERVRFARDLHDLLGHTLSVMVVKAQLARKLVTVDPEAAAAQAADIETTGRQALTEVRQAVSGYRGRGLSLELANASSTLADAGYTASVSYDGEPLPTALDLLLGWTVREGVTNIIKHSGGRRCSIDIRRDSEAVTVEITDDGPGSSVLPSGGHGLAGLRERVAAADGTLDAGPRPEGGFRLAVSVPLLASAQQVAV